MPVRKKGNKYAIGSGPARFKSRAAAERAYRGYRASKGSGGGRGSGGRRSGGRGSSGRRR